MKTISTFTLNKKDSNKVESVKIIKSNIGYAVCYKNISIKKEKLTIYETYTEARYEYTKILLYLLSYYNYQK